MDKKQRRPKDEEIPIPKRGDFLRNLKKVAKPKTSRRSRPKK
jgi:hypothetical protein